MPFFLYFFQPHPQPRGCADSVVLRAHCKCTTLAVVDLPASRLLVKVGRRVFVAITVSATAIGQAR